LAREGDARPGHRLPNGFVHHSSKHAVRRPAKAAGEHPQSDRMRGGLQTRPSGRMLRLREGPRGRRHVHLGGRLHWPLLQLEGLSQPPHRGAVRIHGAARQSRWEADVPVVQLVPSVVAFLPGTGSHARGLGAPITRGQPQPRGSGWPGTAPRAGAIPFRLGREGNPPLRPRGRPAQHRRRRRKDRLPRNPDVSVLLVAGNSGHHRGGGGGAIPRGGHGGGRFRLAMARRRAHGGRHSHAPVEPVRRSVLRGAFLLRYGDRQSRLEEVVTHAGFLFFAGFWAASLSAQAPPSQLPANFAERLAGLEREYAAQPANLETLDALAGSYAMAGRYTDAIRIVEGMLALPGAGNDLRLRLAQ